MRNNASCSSYPYGWSFFEQSNKNIESLLNEFYPQVMYIDVTTSHNLRGDSYLGDGDCLHSCIPGPIDTYFLFHYNAMLSLAIKLDGEQSFLDETETAFHNVSMYYEADG